MTLPVFSAEFQQRLKLEKYTAWAHNLSAEHLEGLLWLVGEVGARGHCMLELFDSHPEICLSSPTKSHSIRMRLECISRFKRGDRFDVAEAKRRFVQARSQMEIADLPEPVGHSVTKAAPDVIWNHVSVSEYGHELWGKDISGTECNSRVGFEGELVFRTILPPEGVPEAVSMAFRAHCPDCRLFYCYGVGTPGEEFDEYEFWFRLRDSQAPLRYVVVSADGTNVAQPHQSGKRVPMLAQAFDQRIYSGKYTRWAGGLSEAGLEGLLWILGAVATETLPLLKPISALVDLETWPNVGNALRPRIALDRLFRVVVRGDRVDVEQARDFFNSCSMGEWDRARHEAIPVTVKRAVDKAIPKTERVLLGWDKSAEGYRISGGRGIGEYFSVSVRHGDGHVVVSKSKPKEKVPRAVLSALRLRLPTYELLTDVRTEGPEWRIVERYKFFVRLRDGETLRVAVSPDGANVEIDET